MTKNKYKKIYGYESGSKANSRVTSGSGRYTSYGSGTGANFYIRSFYYFFSRNGTMNLHWSRVFQYPLF